jgi:hypothetical protein
MPEQAIVCGIGTNPTVVTVTSSATHVASPIRSPRPPLSLA